MQTSPAIAMEWVVVVFIGLLGLAIQFRIWWTNQIDLSGLLSEPTTTTTSPALDASGAPLAPVPNPSGGAPQQQTTTTIVQGKASLSRFQMLIFTFVIAGLYLTLCLEAGSLIDIPNQVLGLIGISGGTLVISKGIQANS